MSQYFPQIERVKNFETRGVVEQVMLYQTHRDIKSITPAFWKIRGYRIPTVLAKNYVKRFLPHTKFVMV